MLPLIFIVKCHSCCYCMGIKNPKTIWLTKENKLWIENKEGTKLKRIENISKIDSVNKYRIVLAIDQNISNKYVLEIINELRDKGKNKFYLLVNKNNTTINPK